MKWNERIFLVCLNSTNLSTFRNYVITLSTTLWRIFKFVTPTPSTLFVLSILSLIVIFSKTYRGSLMNITSACEIALFNGGILHHVDDMAILKAALSLKSNLGRYFKTRDNFTHKLCNVLFTWKIDVRIRIYLDIQFGFAIGSIYKNDNNWFTNKRIRAFFFLCLYHIHLKLILSNMILYITVSLHLSRFIQCAQAPIHLIWLK